jgi:hypothetical protein
VNPQDVDRLLRRAFRRQTPPPEFVERILARLDEPAARAAPPARPARSPVWRAVATLAAGVALAVAVAVAASHYDARRRAAADAERAKQDLAVALEITSAKLNDVQQMIRARGERRF